MSWERSDSSDTTHEGHEAGGCEVRSTYATWVPASWWSASAVGSDALGALRVGRTMSVACAGAQRAAASAGPGVPSTTLLCATARTSATGSSCAGCTTSTCAAPTISRTVAHTRSSSTALISPVSLLLSPSVSDNIRRLKKTTRGSAVLLLLLSSPEMPPRVALT